MGKRNSTVLIALMLVCFMLTACASSKIDESQEDSAVSASSEVVSSRIDQHPDNQCLFDIEGIDKILDDNYAQVKENGYAELRIPLSTHGYTEDIISDRGREVGKKLLDNGYSAYVVGGCIRDLVLGKEVSDIDIVTDATLEQQEELFGDALGTHISNGRVFGYVTFPDEIVDLVTMQNIPASFAGLPGVPEFNPDSLISTSLLCDSFERDLTINAVYYDLSNGDLVDYHGGLHDIREGVLDTMVDADTELSCNPSVLIRALRFKARYDFDISERLDGAIREKGKEYVKTIDATTAFFNAAKMMNAGYSLECYHVLCDYKLLDSFYPPLSALVDDGEYADYLEKALTYMDSLHNDDSKTVSDTLALLVFLQPEIDRRALRKDFETALNEVLTEQETLYDLSSIRRDLTAVSLLEHDMELSYDPAREIGRDQEGYEDALLLYTIKEYAGMLVGQPVDSAA